MIDDLIPLTVADFGPFYTALYGYQPFAWQKRLAHLVCTEGWPSYIKLPTASGKTAAIDIAVFSLAYQAAMVNRPDGVLRAPRRIFFVVDRRIIVNEAYRRASAAAKRLRNVLDQGSSASEAPDNHRILTQVAQWLKFLADEPTAPPLDCFELRGGIYRNDAWVRSMLQPTVLTSTVDQVGSRLLFRGYGVANTSLSIHAALTANDSLIILDEAHCSKPFSQTVSTIKRYKGEKWCKEIVHAPLDFVQMTATLPAIVNGNEVFQLTDDDHKMDPELEKRHTCSKPIRLVSAQGAKGTKLTKILSSRLVTEAIRLNTEEGRSKIAVVVNRVAIARECFAELEKKYPGRVHLMIGRMRPFDRDKLTSFLQSEFGSCAAQVPTSKTSENVPQFVVATQCLEVGADLDFDGMVSQCASLDALRQRFGRLNRLGETPEACGSIVAAEGDVPPLDKLDPSKPLDPIYGNALATTWHWLMEESKVKKAEQNGEDVNYYIDFGIQHLDGSVKAVENLAAMFAPSEDAPTLMPAHVDMLCQTSQRPTPEPDVSTYLHGPNRGVPEIRVCWRADLDFSSIEHRDVRWIDTVELCPPSTSECLSVPLHLFRKWLSGEKATDSSGDVLGELNESSSDDDYQDSSEMDSGRRVLVWRGKGKRGEDDSSGSFCIDSKSFRRLRPNDTVVIPVEMGGWELFGHIPDAPKESTKPALETYVAMLGLGEDKSLIEEAKSLAKIDIASEAFLENRAKSVFRVHPKLEIEPTLQKLADALLKEAKNENGNFSISHWREHEVTLEVLNGYSQEELQSQDRTAPTIIRLTQWADAGGKIRKVKGKILRYPGGVIWISDRHQNLTRSEILPLSSFGDDADELLLVGRLPLLQHLSDVHAESRRLANGLSLSSNLADTASQAAKIHDLGKVDPRFQAMLINKPLSAAFMQSQLWAKSDSASPRGVSTLQNGFRHEMLSVQLIGSFEGSQDNVDDTLLAHLVASHHGYARPFVPICIDKDLPEVNLGELGGGVISSEKRQGWTPTHRLDSGIAQRFWKLNRQYGWWGLAFLESTIRLADWRASANPGQSKEMIRFSATKSDISTKTDHKRKISRLVLSGIDGSNPLAFLAALGVLRTLVLHARDSELRLNWDKINGAWRPVLSSSSQDRLTAEFVIDTLEECLNVSESEHPALRLAKWVDSEGVRRCFEIACKASTLDDRQDVDWLSCNGSELADPSSISQLQTTRRDYHSINIKGLLATTERGHIQRTLFDSWDYADPIAGVSLHLEPREDRRHAYQWHMPSGDPTRSTNGGMIGANRLALEAWPLFQSLPSGDKLATVGFRGLKASNTNFHWPIWSVPIDLDTIRSLLSLRNLTSTKEDDILSLNAMGIDVIYNCRRILVGKTPNLTAAEPLIAN